MRPFEIRVEGFATFTAVSGFGFDLCFEAFEWSAAPAPAVALVVAGQCCSCPPPSDRTGGCYQRSVHTLDVGPTVPLVATAVMNAQLLPDVTPGMGSHVPPVVYSSPDV